MTWGHEHDKDGHVFPSKVYPYNRMHSPSSNLHSNVEDMARWPWPIEPWRVGW